MKKKWFWSLIILITLSCNSDNDNSEGISTFPDNIAMLTLGDSYTIGENVCASCSFPQQLKEGLSSTLNKTIQLDIIASTGWTTAELLQGIAEEDPPLNYDLVTLLIGVNNQFQGQPFSIFEEEFELLVDQAIAKGKNDSGRLVILSIPDYAFTPIGGGFGNPNTTSTEIDNYNDYIQNYCTDNNISFINITDISREGLNDPELVASDGLHLSEQAYSRFVERLLPLALDILD